MPRERANAPDGVVKAHRSRRSAWLGTLLLLALPWAPFLDAPWNAIGVGLVGAFALRQASATPSSHSDRSGRWLNLPTLAAVLVAAASLALLAPWGIERTFELRDRAAIEGAIGARWSALWEGLGQEAERAASALGGPAHGDPERLEAFERLTELMAAKAGEVAEAGGRAGRPTLLLVDPDGEAVAWAGEGLVNEPDPMELARQGFDVSASFGSVSLVAVHPLEEGNRPWRVVAGRSFRTDRLPFDLSPAVRVRLGTEAIQWSAARVGTPLPTGADAISPDGVPMFVWIAPGEVTDAPWPWQETERRIAWGLLASLLLVVVVVRGLRVALPAGSDQPVGRSLQWGGLVAVTAAGMAAAVLAAGADAGSAAVVFGGFLLAGAGIVAGGGGLRLRLRGTLAPFVAGGMGMLCLAGAYTLLPEAVGRSDLAARMWPGAAGAALRAGVAAAVMGLLLATRRGVAGGTSDRSEAKDPRATGTGSRHWVWLALALLLAAAALHDLTWVGLALSGGAAGAGAIWIRGQSLRLPRVAALVVVLAAGLGATGWETVDRALLKDEVGSSLLAGMAPPTADEQDALLRSIDDSFSGSDLAAFVPRDLEGLERRDLAFSLWRRSPLARPNALSAVLVEPFTGPPSSFAFGPQVATERGPNPQDWVVVPWEELGLPAWDETQVAGETTLEYAGVPWATVRYWLLPRPGFALGRSTSFDAIELGLLRSREAGGPEVPGLPEPVAYALYAPDGRALVSPWPESPPLPEELATGTPAAREVVQTPSDRTPFGRSWAWSRPGRDGIEVLYLPVLGPFAALERAGAHAVGNLLALAVAGLLVLLLALPRPAFREVLGRTLRSYSKRLMVVLTLLVVLPLFLFNLVVLADAEERMLREQRVSGEAALASAQQVIGDYVASLEPGFGFTSLVDDELLMWLSEVVHHQVNLYWGSSIWASSKPELFAAGMLPERIPGEIFSRLALLGYDRASRTNLAGSVAHLEIYAPLRIPGAPADQERIFLSMPLLAQQQEVAEELGLLRRRAMLLSAVLFGLLIAVGAALARRFAEPIEELVEGTRRIAAGAPSLDLAPRELELAALVDAVDSMARRIAESRERLVREKQVVERMVENITSGVISLDRERRVLMRNKVAWELLGVEIGDRIDEALERTDDRVEDGGRGRLAPVAEFLGETERATGRPRRSTVRLVGPEEGEEREWSLVWVPVPGTGEPAALLVVEDATEVLRSQRLQAWAEMARVIAHEIKNPLTPLRLSTEHMREVHREGGAGFDAVFERCTDNILQQVEELRQIAAEFSTFSSIPRIDPHPGDLVRAMDDLVKSYRSSEAAGVAVELESSRREVPARFDERLLARAVRNLIENSLRASGPSGRVEVGISVAEDSAAIAVRDEGIGVPPELLPHIFDPNFSTYDSGTGLGLPIARRIAEEHGGTIAARNRPGGGLEVTIRIPV